jgi:hypothetical protein
MVSSGVFIACTTCYGTDNDVQTPNPYCRAEVPVSVDSRSDTHMTHDDRFNDITTDAEFETTLTALLTTAHENDLTVEKPWLCRTSDGIPDWEATVVELDGAAAGGD